MARNLVVCCDGTWNTLDQREGGVLIPTNVARIYNATADTDALGQPQVRYYHPGVGTDPKMWDRIAGGATGAGLDRNIMSAYQWLSTNYQTGDRIWLFGFSRGAYTARSLGGFILRCGLIDGTNLPVSELWANIDRMFRKGYRGHVETNADWNFALHAFPANEKKIHFIGVWDTVGALGIPDDQALLNLFDTTDEHKFHDTNLGADVAYARHAIALDEKRDSFQPTLWQPNGVSDLKQVWFPGVHSDVGGGYRETGLSDGALEWMIAEASAGGLAFNPKMTAQIKSDFQDAMHDSWTSVFKILPNRPRSMPDFSTTAVVPPPDKPFTPSPIGQPVHYLHPSTINRRNEPPITDAPYRLTCALPAGTSQSFDIYALQPWNATGLWLTKGRDYTFSATGEWVDSSIPCGPDGTDDGDFHAGELVQSIFSVVGEFEELWKKVAKNPQADLKGTKRHDRINGERVAWFCLVGAIANGGTANANGEPEPHETFKIGSGCRYTPKESGYFYAYANDAWNFYDNNRGSVTLTVTSS
jgi:hypothetical protein